MHSSPGVCRLEQLRRRGVELLSSSCVLSFGAAASRSNTNICIESESWSQRLSWRMRGACLEKVDAEGPRWVAGGSENHAESVLSEVLRSEGIRGWSAQPIGKRNEIDVGSALNHRARQKNRVAMGVDVQAKKYRAEWGATLT
eukprot:10769-Heterococcus_DN1.PRE.2